MIKSLHIENYVLTGSLDISFPEGLSIITGQTGAGKSLLLGAVSLLTGAKGDVGMIPPSAESCVVEGEFTVPEEALPILEEAEADADGGVLLIRRVINRNGRSRAFVGDSPVPVQVLQDLGRHLVDIHGQHQSLLLADARFRMKVLDSVAHTAEELSACKASWKELQGLKSQLEETSESLRRAAADKEYNEARFRQLDDAHLREGELEELEAEQKRLSHAEAISEALAQASAIFEPGDAPGLESSIKEAARLIGKIEEFVPSLSGISERLQSARIEIADIRESVADAASAADVSPDRLQIVEDRMGLIYDLLQKFGCRDEAALIAEKARYAEVVSGTDALEERIASLRKEIDSVQKRHAALCEALHDARSKAAPGLAFDIQESLRFLELDRAVFGIEVREAPAGPEGSDAIVFTFDASGRNPEDVARCASGGELSRIMLSLKAIMARYSGMPTLFFDEIDTGVSGSAADRMGRMICDMGSDMQVIAITHLPQVAAKGNAHFVVEKSFSDDGSFPVTGMHRVDGDDRVMEIARLLSGERITEEAVANARSLLYSNTTL